MALKKSGPVFGKIKAIKISKQKEADGLVTKFICKQAKIR
jgi:hypothetical protein